MKVSASMGAGSAAMGAYAEMPMQQGQSHHQYMAGSPFALVRNRRSNAGATAAAIAAQGAGGTGHGAAQLAQFAPKTGRWKGKTPA